MEYALESVISKSQTYKKVKNFLVSKELRFMRHKAK